MGSQAEQILENIVQLAELLDDEILKEMEDVSFLELAKAVSIKRFDGGPAGGDRKKRREKQNKNMKLDSKKDRSEV